MKILAISANPLNSEPLRLDEELRDIRDCLSADPEQRFSFEVRLAARAQDLQRLLLEVEPTIVHFTGHGDETGQLLLETEIGYPQPVTAEALAELFRLFRGTVRCVILNACHSAEQAKLVAEVVGCAVGMKGPISQGAGKAFSVSFFRALSYGKDVSTAFELGRNQIGLVDLEDEQDVPVLYADPGADNLSVTTSSTKSASGGDVIAAAKQLEEFISTLTTTSTLSLISPSYDEGPPPIVEKRSMRASTCGKLISAAGTRAWLAIHGAIGSGKTNLLALIASAEKRCIWLRMRGRTATEALSIVDSTFAQIRARRFGETKAAWYRDCCLLLGDGTLIVFDDLPRTSGREEFDDCLIFMAEAVSSSNCRLYTAGATELSNRVRVGAGDRLLQIPVPPFSGEEVLEVLVAHGAPPHFQSPGWITTLLTASSGHPMLIAEAVTFLKQSDWRDNDATLMEIFAGRFANKLETPVHLDLERTVQDPETRELLYRLRLVGGPFTEEDARLVASIPSSINRVAERTSSLLGLWIQPDSQNRYLVSPLISRVASSNLDIETEKLIHIRLAESILAKSPLTPIAALQAIQHFVSAGAPARAASILLSALQALLHSDYIGPESIISYVWSDLPLPTEIPIAMRLGIRATQIALFQKQNRDQRYAIDDLVNLLSTATLDAQNWEIETLMSCLVASHLLESRPVLASTFLSRAVTILRTAPPLMGPIRSNRVRNVCFEMFWMALSRVTDDADVLSILNSLDELSSNELEEMCETSLSEGALNIACNDIWLRRSKKNESDRDWDAALSSLAAIRDWATRRNSPQWYSKAQCSAAVILAEYLDRFGEAIKMLEGSISSCDSDGKSIFWIHECLGRQYYYRQDWNESLFWLSKCVASPASVDAPSRADATCRAGIAAVRGGHSSGSDYLSQASEIVQQHRSKFGAVSAAAILAEVGIERWQRGERAQFFTVWSNAAQILLDASINDDSWKIAITLFGAYSGYFSFIATGHADQDWNLIKPLSGVIFDKGASVLDMFDSSKLFVIPAQLTFLAEGLGMFHESLTWALRTTLTDFTPDLKSVIVPYRVAAYLANENFLVSIKEARHCFESAVSTELTDDVKRANRNRGGVALILMAAFLLKVRVEKGTAFAHEVWSEITSYAQASFEEFDDSEWVSAFQILREVAEGNRDWEISYAEALEHGENGHASLNVMCRLSALANAPPRSGYQLTVHSFLQEIVNWVPLTSYHSTMVPCLRAFWEWSIDNCSIYYTRPVRLKTEFQQEMATPGYEGLKRGLKLLATNLNVDLSDAQVQMLSDTGKQLSSKRNKLLRPRWVFTM